MLELVLLIVGIVLQLGGVALTIIGARTVWKDIKSPDDRFLAPFIRVGRWTAQRWHRVRAALGFPGRTQAIMAASIASATMVGEARVTRSFGPLPAGLTTEQAIQALGDRIREVQALAYEQAQDAEQRVRQAVENLAAEQRQAQHDIEEIARRERQTAVHGLRLEAYGFILLTLGTLVQAFGSYLGIELPPR